MSPVGGVTKILIVDDHPLIREGISMRLTLQPDLRVCGEAESIDDALKLVDEMAPELVLIDISLKSGHGIDLIKQIKSRHPQIKMLVVSGYEESLYGDRALRAGALGYLNKQESNEKLLEAVRRVLAGKRFVSPALAQRLLDQALGAKSEAETPIQRLSNRELEVFRLIGEGLATGVIAEQLFISPHTVDSHRENIKRKLGLADAGELTRAAVQWALENG